MKELVYILFALLFFTACSESESLLPDSQTQTKSAQAVVVSQWMNGIDSQTSLNKLTIPGTHDSGARYGGVLAECQTKTITQQLNSGIRFLDIRCALKNGKLKIYHGIMSQNADLDDVLNECTAFLTQNPSETIVMSIKNEAGGSSTDFATAVDGYIERTSQYWYLGASVPSLGTVRGKIALFRRYGASDKGIDMSSGWADNATFTIGNVKVQDKYTVSSTSKIAEKWTSVESLLNEAKSGNGSLLYVNFCSGTGIWGSYPKVVAWGSLFNKGVLQYLEGYLVNNPAARPLGCVLMDFPSDALIKSLVETNFATN